MIDTHIYYKMIAIIRLVTLVSPHIMHNCLCFYVVVIFKIYSLKNSFKYYI